ncbi:MAG: hypothetical protein P4L03_10220 [Terracidiphilus sp.]|nr:hypothetical protein [Terracidiphilus sp.]
MHLRNLLWAALATAASLSAYPLDAQQSFYENFRAHNARMTEVQPTWMGPITQSDARLTQAMRFSVANWTQPGAHPISYANNHGITMVFVRRLQVELDPPPFLRNHATGLPDGFANLGAQIKYRIASGNAQHGNYAVSAILSHGFAPRASRNFALSSYNEPSITAGKAFGRLALITQVGGWLPTAKVAAQGRTLNWTMTGQIHAGQHAWFDVENNFTHFFGSPIDSQSQNMITPAAFYMIRRKQWKPEHAAYVLDCGLQTATSGFHTYNHNLITELRVLF